MAVAESAAATDSFWIFTEVPAPRMLLNHLELPGVIGAPSDPFIPFPRLLSPERIVVPADATGAAISPTKESISRARIGADENPRIDRCDVVESIRMFVVIGAPMGECGKRQTDGLQESDYMG